MAKRLGDNPLKKNQGLPTNQYNEVYFKTRVTVEKEVKSPEPDHGFVGRLKRFFGK